MCVSKYQTLVYGNKLLNINLQLTFIFGVKAAALSASPDQVDCQVFFPHNSKHFLFPVWLPTLSQTVNLGLCETVYFGPFLT